MADSVTRKIKEEKEEGEAFRKSRQSSATLNVCQSSFTSIVNGLSVRRPHSTCAGLLFYMRRESLVTL